MTAHDDAIAADAQSRLHNSGPVPQEVFRTPAIGTVTYLLLTQTILAWDAWADRPLYPEKTPLPERLPPAFAHEAARRALVRLGEPEPRAGVPRDPERGKVRACELIAELARVLGARGELADWMGIATCEVLSAPQAMGAANVRTQNPPTDLEVARSIVAYSVIAPPLLLWTRPPTLHRGRKFNRITLRRFGVAAPAPAEATR